MCDGQAELYLVVEKVEEQKTEDAVSLSDDATGLLSKFTEHSTLNCEKFYFKSKTVLVLLSNQRQ